MDAYKQVMLTTIVGLVLFYKGENTIKQLFVEIDFTITMQKLEVKFIFVALLAPLIVFSFPFYVLK